MHNRVRMITAMCLAKDLVVDWHLGERVCNSTSLVSQVFTKLLYAALLKDTQRC
jgi:hypothetical protein